MSDIRADAGAERAASSTISLATAGRSITEESTRRLIRHAGGVIGVEISRDAWQMILCVSSAVHAAAASNSVISIIYTRRPRRRRGFEAPVPTSYETAQWLKFKGVQNCIGIIRGGTVQVGPLPATMMYGAHRCGTIGDCRLLNGGELAGHVFHLNGGRDLPALSGTPGGHCDPFKETGWQQCRGSKMVEKRR
jgi:hypothetical protein